MPCHATARQAGGVAKGGWLDEGDEDGPQEECTWMVHSAPQEHRRFVLGALSPCLSLSQPQAHQGVPEVGHPPRLWNAAVAPTARMKWATAWRLRN